jgi:hypothetical protein
MLEFKLRYNLMEVNIAINIEIVVVIISIRGCDTELIDPKEELKTEQTITGRSKYLLTDLNSRNLFLCFSER